MERFRCALVGLGRMGVNHFKTIAADPRFDLPVVMDPEAKLPPAHNDLSPATRLLRSPDKLLKEKFDCAVVASPTQTHFEVVKTLLEAGKHVLVEKPAAGSAAECQKLVDLANEKGLRLAVGNVERCNPVVSALRDVLESGIIGVPVHLNCLRGGGFPGHVQEGNHVLLDLAVHDLDILHMILGPLHISRTIGHSTHLAGIIDTAEISLESQDGISANVHVNWLSPHRLRHIRVIGTQGVCEVNYLDQSCKIFGKELEPEALKAMRTVSEFAHENLIGLEVEVEKSKPLEGQLSEFYKFLTGRDHILATDDQLVETVRLVDQAMEQIGKPVDPSFFERAGWQPHFLRQDAPLLN